MGNWMQDNKWIEWVFSGIGVAGLTVIAGLTKKRFSKKSLEDQKVPSNQAQIIGNGTIYQAGGNINLPPKQQPKYDELFYDRVIQELDDDNFLCFIQSVCNHCSVEKEEIKKFRDFIHWASKPTNSFTNLQAQKLFEDFLEQCEQLISFTSTHFFYRRGVNDASVRYLYPDLNFDLDGSGDRKDMEKFDKYADELYRLCSLVEKKYRVFAKESRRFIFD